MDKLYNNNGQTYEVLELCNFNDIDKEYYKNSWQKYFCALLRGQFGEYIIASYVGENEWGNGTYLSKDDRDVAYGMYHDMVAKYYTK